MYMAMFIKDSERTMCHLFVVMLLSYRATPATEARNTIHFIWNLCKCTIIEKLQTQECWTFKCTIFYEQEGYKDFVIETNFCWSLGGDIKCDNKLKSVELL